MEKCENGNCVWTKTQLWTQTKNKKAPKDQNNSRLKQYKETQNKKQSSQKNRTTKNWWQYGWTWLDKTCIDSEN